MLEPYRYLRPTTLQEASEMLCLQGAMALAGGTDLLVEMRERKRKPPVMVDLKHLTGLRGIEHNQANIRLGALTTVTDVLEDSRLTARLPALKQAAEVFACCEIRHRATLGGNVANASPGAEFTVPLVALDAAVEIWGPEGPRAMTLSNFLLGPGQTDLETGEFVTGLSIPLTPDMRCAYRRKARTRGMDLAAVSLAVVAHGASRPEERRICLSMGAVERVPPRPSRVEAMLSGVRLTRELTAHAGQALIEPLAPRASSLRASPTYKKAVLPVLLRRLLEELDLMEA